MSLSVGHAARPSQPAAELRRRRLKRAQRALALIVATLGFSVLVGWALDISLLKSISADLVSMKPNAALCLLLGGAAAAFLSPPRRLVVIPLALLISIIGIVTLAEYLYHRNVGIDQFLFRETEDAIATSAPGRMSPTTALGFLLLGISMIMVALRRDSFRLPQILSAATAFIAYAATLGYLFGATSLYGLGRLTNIALHTSAGLLLLAFATFAATLTREERSIFFDETAGGIVLRRLLLPAILIPTFLGIVIQSAFQFRVVDEALAIALFVLLTLSLFMVAIWRNAYFLHELDAARRDASAISEQKTETLEKLNRIGSILSTEMDPKALIQAVTDAATDLCGAGFGAFFYNVTTESGDAYMLYSLSGAREEDFKGFSLPRATELFSPTFRGEAAIRLADVREDPRYGGNAPHYGLPKGHLPVVSYLAVPVVSRSGNVLGGLFFGHPERGRFTAEAERLVTGLASQAAVAIDNARLYEASVAANRAKDEFLATLSHELRTPMTAIIGWSRMLREDLDDDTRREALETIQRSAEIQSRLIDDVLDISRIVRGKVHIAPTEMDLADVTRSAIDSVRSAAAARGIRIESSLNDTPMVGDPDRLQQVVWNLLSNAIKFTPEGGQLSIEIRSEPEFAELIVSDDGMGIEPRHINRIFEPFNQADNSTTRVHGGLGLGLSIVRYIAEAHGGTVTASSDGPGKGTTFRVRLPHVSAVQWEEPAVRRRNVNVERTVERDLRGRSVLFVDDHSDTRHLVDWIIRRAGGRVLTASSVAEALAVLADTRVDIVVSDIAMPEQDGFALARAIRTEPDWSGLPLVAMTAFGRLEDRNKALACGFDEWIVKPVDPSTLIDVLYDLSGPKGEDAT